MAKAVGIDPATGDPVRFDLTDPAFREAYFDLVLHPMEDEGVDFWWLDWQQGRWSRVPGLDPLWLLNHLHFLDSARNGKRPLTFSRYAGPGSHRYPVGFSGDSVISWASLEFQPYFTATASNIGYGWWSHDIGGHMFGVKDDELATRWVQLGCFSPINRLHSTLNPFNSKEPWRFSPVAEAVQSDVLRLRHRLVPYLYTMNERAHSQGRPLVEPLYWTEPIPEVLSAKTSFLFGSELLVAAITSPAVRGVGVASVQTRLPAGTWIDTFTGVVYDGGRSVTLHRPLEAYPVLAKAGGIVPLTSPDALAVDNPAALEVRVYAGADGAFTLYEDDDAASPRAVRTPIVFDWAAGTLTIGPATGELDVIPAEREWTVTLVGAAQTTVEGHEARWDAATGSLSVTLGAVPVGEAVTVTFAGPPGPGRQRRGTPRVRARRPRRGAVRGQGQGRPRRDTGSGSGSRRTRPRRAGPRPAAGGGGARARARARDPVRLSQLSRLSRLERWLLAAVVLQVVGGAVWLTTYRGLFDPRGMPIGNDFAAFWFGAQYALGHPAVGTYDLLTMTQFQHAAWPELVGMYAWVYPPSFLLLVLGFGLMPYVVSFLVWTVTTLAAFLAGVWQNVRDRTSLWLVVAFPGLWLGLGQGQNQFLTAALGALGLGLLRRHPVWAGVCIGLLCIKPHLALLFPVALVAARAWRTILAAAVTAVTVTLVPAAILGWDTPARLARRDGLGRHGDRRQAAARLDVPRRLPVAALPRRTHGARVGRAGRHHGRGGRGGVQDLAAHGGDPSRRTAASPRSSSGIRCGGRRTPVP